MNNPRPSLNKKYRSQHQKLESFLEKIGWENHTQECKIEEIKKMSFDDFFPLISRLNGLVLGNTKEKRGIYKEALQTVGIRLTLPCIDYHAPIEKIQLFEIFFQDMKKNLSLENYSAYAMKLRFALDFLQLFEDGNGRTAIYTHDLLLNSSLHSEETYGEKYRKNRTFLTEQIKRNALDIVLPQEIPANYAEYFYGSLNGKWLSLNFIVGSSRAISMGLAAPLQAVAFIKTIEEMEGKNTHESRKIFRTALSDDGETFKMISTGEKSKEIYTKYYTDLQNKFFETILAIVEESIRRGNTLISTTASFNDRVLRLI